MIHDASNASVRKRSAVDSKWHSITPHRKEARFDDDAYPLTSTFHPMIEHDNEIDTAAVAPIVRTILLHNSDTEATLRYQRGRVVWLSQSASGCTMHHGYRGLAYWTVSSAATAVPFVMAEPTELGPGSCCVVAVAIADATVISIGKKEGVVIGRLETSVVLAGAAGQYAQRTGRPLMQGDTIAIEKHQANFTQLPLIVTLLQAFEYEREISVCIHPPLDPPLTGLYKHTRR